MANLDFLDKKIQLSRILGQYEQLLTDGSVSRIEIIGKDGSRHGIGNPSAVNVMMEAAIKELKRQISQL